MHKKPLRIIAAITALCFLTGQGGWAFAQEPQPQAQPQAQPQPAPVPAQPAYPPPPPGYPPPGYPPPGYPPPYYYPPPGAQLRPQPVRYEMRPRVGLIVAGSVVFGATYLMTVLFTSTIDNIDCALSSSSSSSSKPPCNRHWPMYIPIVGPFADIPNLINDKATAFVSLAVLDGLAQTAGLAMLIAGAVTRKRVPVYSRVMPVIQPGGLALMGRF